MDNKITQLYSYSQTTQLELTFVLLMLKLEASPVTLVHNQFREVYSNLYPERAEELGFIQRTEELGFIQITEELGFIQGTE